MNNHLSWLNSTKMGEPLLLAASAVKARTRSPGECSLKMSTCGTFACRTCNNERKTKIRFKILGGCHVWEGALDLSITISKHNKQDIDRYKGPWFFLASAVWKGLNNYISPSSKTSICCRVISYTNLKLWPHEDMQWTYTTRNTNIIRWTWKPTLFALLWSNIQISTNTVYIFQADMFVRKK
jgi:hypothetical protein